MYTIYDIKEKEELFRGDLTDFKTFVNDWWQEYLKELDDPDFVDKVMNDYFIVTDILIRSENDFKEAFEKLIEEGLLQCFNNGENVILIQGSVL